MALLAVVFMGAGPAAPAGGPAGTAIFGWQPFGFLLSSHYGWMEQGGLLVCLVIAILGLAYASRLMKEVYAADTGTASMQEIAKAVREGANAYLRRQFTVVGVLIVLITLAIVAAKWPWHLDDAHHTKGELIVVSVGRGIAFLMGSLFSALVGFTGMRLATAGNLRVAAAAKVNFGTAMRLAYKTGTVTGMFTCGLGLLGGSLILLVFGELAYETLLGFGFGGSLLALFMRVGGGIYTKAADVGADLVGKVEADIAEDDPRNAATIADNVGDNVGDCAGMAADVFESYAVTMVAAVILGFASIGFKGMIFPLMVMAVGVISSLISTALVGRGMVDGNATSAMKSINNGFYRSAIISIFGFMALGAIYLNFSGPYIVGVAIDRGLYEEPQFQKMMGLPEYKAYEVVAEMKAARKAEGLSSTKALQLETELEKYRRQALAKWFALTPEEQEAKAAERLVMRNKKDRIEGLLFLPYDMPPDKPFTMTLTEYCQGYVPLTKGMHLAAALCCLIGILLAVALNKCTEYWTSTDYQPVKDVVKASRTGHATNIISGLSLGYESSVWAALIIAVGVMSSVMIYQDTNNLLFIAFGVAMTGIGMLTLTGDTISMDVFGPVADNANGIGEMGFNRAPGGMIALKEGDPEFIPETELKDIRQRLADLDAVGNTTKAITKGVAIGSAVIAAVSLFASFIAVLVTGSEEKIGQLTIGDFVEGAAKLTVADPYVFIGMLIGGAVPLLFSAMTIRAVGRAAYLIVFECRKQFRDKEIWEGRKRPDYSAVVDICTSSAQKELIGPGLLAIGAPLVVGFLLGPFALGGFLAGMILVGQLLAVFMSNAGGAWDNAKKMIEDEPKSKENNTGKGSDKHKASVTGDTVGDPLKDTAGPAINPLIKVMNMVSLLALPLVIMHNIKDSQTGDRSLGAIVLTVAALAVAWAWWRSKQESATVKEMDAEMERHEHGQK
jgi:K(+)-stimulated pyrophosphate-energized sodium pump